MTTEKATDKARVLFPFIVRDAIGGLAAREAYDESLEHLARRRAALYAEPRSLPEGESYWTSFAQALAPDAPPHWMPLAGLIESGVTLEGGAKGLRGLFTREPSERERRRVLKTATLGARVMELVASSGGTIRPEERRLMAMTMASFGLSAEERTQVQPLGTVTFESLEIFGDLDARTRRELLRAAWLLGFADKVDPQKELVVRAIAARLEVSAECDAIRAEVHALLARQEETATAAVELARAALRATTAPDLARPWLDHLIAAVAPPARRALLAQTAATGARAQPELLPRMDASRRRQAVALAYATMLGPDPSAAVELAGRVELRVAASAAGALAEFAEATARVDRFLFECVREAIELPAESPVAAAPATPPGGGARPHPAKPPPKPSGNGSESG